MIGDGPVNKRQVTGVYCIQKKEETLKWPLGYHGYPMYGNIRLFRAEEWFLVNWIYGPSLCLSTNVRPCSSLSHFFISNCITAFILILINKNSSLPTSLHLTLVPQYLKLPYPLSLGHIYFIITYCYFHIHFQKIIYAFSCYFIVHCVHCHTCNY